MVRTGRLNWQADFTNYIAQELVKDTAINGEMIYDSQSTKALLASLVLQRNLIFSPHDFYYISSKVTMMNSQSSSFIHNKR